MADRYWVGGAGTWNTSNTANWSATSGGAGGQSVPTSGDDVYFDVNSGTAAVTVSSVPCRSLTCTGFAGSFSGSGQMSVYGSLTLASTMTSSGFVWYIMSATTGSWTINSGGLTVHQLNISQAASYTLSANLTISSDLTFSQGTLNTANFNLSAFRLVHSNTNATTISLGSSTITLTSSTPLALNATGLTFNAGTSTFNCTSTANLTFAGVNLNFYNLNFTGGGTSTVNVTGANTFNNLSVTANTAGTRNITFDSTTTINGTLSTSGTSSTQRVQFGSSVAGTQRTLSVATIGTLTNTNWKDIALTGAASPWTTPLGVWDFGNNSGIIFSVTTYYWVGGAGTWDSSSATNWASSSGGSGGAGVPGPNDNVVFDTNSGTGVIAYSTAQTTAGYCNDLTVTATQALTFGTTSSGYLYVYGNIAFPVGGSVAFAPSNSQYYYFKATSSKTITTGNKDIKYAVFFFESTSGTWTIQDSISGGNGTIYLNYGTLDTNGKTCSLYSFTVSNTPTLTLGASTITISQGFSFSAAATLNAGTSNITISSNSFSGGGKTYYNVTLYFLGFGTNPFALNGANTFNNLSFVSNVSSTSLIAISANQVVNGTFSASGYSLTQRGAIRSDTIGTQRTITVATAGTFSNVNFRDIVIAGAAAPISGTSIGNCLNNSGITFTAAKTVYWNLAGSQSITSTGWATTSGGTPAAANYPLPQDTAIFNNAGSAGTVQLSSTSYAAYDTDLPGIDCSARTTAMTFNFVNSSKYFVYKNFTLGTGVSITYGGNSYLNFYTDSTQTLTTNGVTINIDRYINSYTVGSGVFYLGSALTMSNLNIAALSLNGNFNSNNYNITVPAIYMGPGTKTFGTSTVNITYNNGTLGSISGYTLAAPVNFNFTYAGATGTRTFTAAAPAAGSDAVGLIFASGTDTIALSGAGVGNLNFTGFSGTLSNSARSIFGNLTISTGMTLAAGINPTTFAATSGTKTITTNGKTIDFPITFNGVGGTWQLQDNLTQGSTRATTLQGGTLDLNGKVMTVGTYLSTVGVEVKNLTFNGGTLVCPGSGLAFNRSGSNFTTTAGTGTGKISLTSASAKTFDSTSATVYNCTLENAGAGALTITGSNTFTTISNSVQPTSFLFTAGTTTTVTNFNVSGTSGNLVTIGSVTAASHTLSKSSGIVSVSYCSISRSTATGGALWQAYTANGNVNGGNNSGWKFSAFSGNGLFFGSNF